MLLEAAPTFGGKVSSLAATAANRLNNYSRILTRRFDRCWLRYRKIYDDLKPAPACRIFCPYAGVMSVGNCTANGEPKPRSFGLRRNECIKNIRKEFGGHAWACVFDFEDKLISGALG